METAMWKKNISNGLGRKGLLLWMCFLRVLRRHGNGARGEKRTRGGAKMEVWEVDCMKGQPSGADHAPQLCISSIIQPRALWRVGGAAANRVRLSESLSQMRPDPASDRAALLFIRRFNRRIKCSPKTSRCGVLWLIKMYKSGYFRAGESNTLSKGQLLNFLGNNYTWKFTQAPHTKYKLHYANPFLYDKT